MAEQGFGEEDYNDEQPAGSDEADDVGVDPVVAGSASLREGNIVSSSESALPGRRSFRDQMSDCSRRLQTFANWPAHLQQSPESLARAGFYFAGTHEKPDLVRCYCCGTGLHKWEPSDDPVVEHASFSPYCRHLQEIMGDWFGKDIQISRRRQAQMQRPSAQACLEFGHTEEEVQRAFAYLEQTEGHSSTDYVSASKLMEVIMNLTDLDLKKDVGRYLQAPDDLAAYLQRDNEEMRRSCTCRVCGNSEVAVVFMPCGHLITCNACARTVSTCPLCHSPIRGTVRAQFD